MFNLLQPPMKRSGFLEESTSSTGEGIDPPTPWVFPACAAIPVQSL